MKEIRGAIGQDLADIEENIEGFTKRVSLYKIIIDHIENELAFSDTLKNNLPYLQGMTTFLSNIGPYETVKSRGLETISNDSIRMKISLYYDFEYEKIQTNEEEHHSHYKTYLKSEIMENFDISNYRLKPLNYEALIKDFEFKQTIYWALRTDNYMLDSYRLMENNGKELVINLSEEIKKLER